MSKAVGVLCVFALIGLLLFSVAFSINETDLEAKILSYKTNSTKLLPSFARPVANQTVQMQTTLQTTILPPTPQEKPSRDLKMVGVFGLLVIASLFGIASFSRF